VNENKFHIDKSMSVGHIVTTITLIGALVVWGIRTESKIELNAARIVATEKRIDREASRQSSESAQIRNSLMRIEDKLDRYVERDDRQRN